MNLKNAYFAGGCFWGVEHLFQQHPGVIDAESGYMGGHLPNPTYEAVCQKNSGHLETVKVTYDAEKVSFADLVKFFFEIHDFEQINGQGPDIGPQYLSAIFIQNEAEAKTVNQVMAQLKKMGYQPATQIIHATNDKTPFYPAESYHQDYYQKTGKQPYCHQYCDIF